MSQLLLHNSYRRPIDEIFRRESGLTDFCVLLRPFDRGGDDFFRLKLGDLAEATLGVGKSGDGLQSLKWWKEGRLDLIEQYCRRDVEVTRDVYVFGQRNGYVLYRDRDGRPLRLPVEWK